MPPSERAALLDRALTAIPRYAPKLRGGRSRVADYLAAFTMPEAQIEWVEERLAATGTGPSHVEAARRARDRRLKLIAELKKRGVWTKYLEGWKADG